ncbi:MAG: LEPR-XLL domain-containing protein, partial [Litorivicinus sp.]
MARRTPPRRLPTWLNALSQGVRACNARKKLYQLENLEPRLLLSATELTLAAGITELKLDVDSTNVRLLDQSDNVIANSTQAASGFGGYSITGSSSADTIEVKKHEAGDSLGTWTLTFNGGAGADTVSFNSAADFGGVSFSIVAEAISLGASADIDTTGDFSLTGQDHSDSYSDSTPTASISIANGASLDAAVITLSASARLSNTAGDAALSESLSDDETKTLAPSAQVSIAGAVNASRALTTSATANTQLDMDINQHGATLTVGPQAQVSVAGTADVDAASWTAATTLSGELDIGGTYASRLAMSGTQLSQISLADAADVDVTGNVTLTALNDFDVLANTDGISGTFDGVMTTRVAAGSAADLDLGSNDLTACATNRAVQRLDIAGPLYSVALNQQTINTEVDFAGSLVTAHDVSLSAIDQSEMVAKARLAQNVALGANRVDLDSATFTLGGDLVAEARDGLQMQALFDNVLPPASGLASGTAPTESDITYVKSFLPIGLEAVVALNHANRNSVASGAGTTLNVTGDVTVDAKRNGAMDATVRLAADASVAALGAVIAENRVGYNAAKISSFTGIANFLRPTQSTSTAITASLTGAATDLDVGGALTLRAMDAVAVNATVSSAVGVSTSGLSGYGLAAGAVYAQTLMDVDVTASLDDGAGTTAQNVGGLTVSAIEDTFVNTNVLVSTVGSVGTDGSVAVLSSELQSLASDYTTVTNAHSLADLIGVAKQLPSSVDFGDTIFVMRDYAGVGTPGKTYRFMGPDNTATNSGFLLDNGLIDFSNQDYWQPETLSTALDEIPNLSGGYGAAVSAAYARNYIESELAADLTNTIVDAGGAVSVTTLADGELTADLDINAEVEASNEVTAEGLGVGLGGLLAINQVLGAATAEITGSTIAIDDADGASAEHSLTVQADQSRTVTANNSSAIVSSGDSVSASVALAFNLIGYESATTGVDLVDMTIDLFLGSGTALRQVDAQASASISASIITGADLNNLSVLANNSATINALFDNDTLSKPKALFTQSNGKAFGFGLTSNLIASSTTANIALASAGQRIDAAGAVRVEATNTSDIDAASTVRNVVKPQSGNNAGISLVDRLIEDVLGDYDYSSVSGTQTLDNGNLVRIASTHGAGGTAGTLYRYVGADGQSIDLSQVNYPAYDAAIDLDAVLPVSTTIAGVTALALGSVVRVPGATASLDRYYRYTGDVSKIMQPVDLSTFFTANSDDFTQLSATDITRMTTVQMAPGRLLRMDDGGTTRFYELASGESAQLVDLSQVNFATDARFNDVTSSHQLFARATTLEQVSNILPDWNLFGGKGHSGGGLLIRNEISGNVEAYIAGGNGYDADIDAASVNIQADSNQRIDAQADGFMHSATGPTIGGMPWNASGSSASVAAGGAIATNNVVSETRAYTVRVALTTTGDANIESTNQAVIDAENTVEIKGDNATAIVLAYNQIGYKSSDIFTQTLNAILGGDYSSRQYTSAQGVQDLVTYDRVQVSSDHFAGGQAGATYLYVGSGVSALDLGAVDYTSGDWVAVGGLESLTTASVSATNTLNQYDLVEVADSHSAGGRAGEVYIYIGTATVSDVSSVDFTADADYELVSDGLAPIVETGFGVHELNPGQRVQVSATHSAGGQQGVVYRYTGTEALRLDLREYNFATDSGVDFAGQAISNLFEKAYALSDGGLITLQQGDLVAVNSTVAGGIAGRTYMYVGEDPLTADLTAQDYSQSVDLLEVALEALGLSMFGEGNTWAHVTPISAAGAMSLAPGAVVYFDGGYYRFTGDEAAAFDFSTIDLSDEPELVKVAFHHTGDSLTTVTNNDIVIVDADHTAGGTPGASYRYTGTSPAGIALHGVDYDSGSWEKIRDDALPSADIIGANFKSAIFGQEQSNHALAFVRDSQLDVGGDLNVLATNSSSITAAQNNTADSSYSAFYTSTDLTTVTVTVATNFISGASLAYIADTGADGTLDIDVDDHIRVVAQDNATVVSESRTKVLSVIDANTGDELLINTLSNFLPWDYTSDDDTVLYFGDRVKTTDGIFKYMGVSSFERAGAGAVNASGIVDLATEDYSNRDYWQPDWSQSATQLGYNIARAAGFLVGGISDRSSSAKTMAGLVVRNDVKGGARAYVSDADVRAGGADLNAGDTALEIAANASQTLTATVDVSLFAAADATLGKSKNSTGGGIIATNALQGSAEAFATGADLVVGTASDGGRDARVVATNNASLTSTNKAAAVDELINGASGGDTAGAMVVLSFNSLGYRPTNILFDTINTLIGYNADRFFDDRESRAGAYSYLENTETRITGDLDLLADNSANMTSSLTNKASSTQNVLGMEGAKGTRVAAQIASNMQASEAQAFIKKDSGSSTIGLDGRLRIDAVETSEMFTDVSTQASFVASSDGGIGLINEGLNGLSDQYAYTSKSGIQLIDAGAVVRHDGHNYMYRGTSGAIDLGAQNYTETGGDWWQVSYDTTSLIPSFNFLESESTSATGALTRNQLKSVTLAHIDGATVRGGDGTGAATAVHVSADGRSILQSDNTSNSQSVGGHTFSSGGGELAVNASIVTNQLMAQTDAYVTDSDIRTDGTGSESMGYADFRRLDLYSANGGLGLDEFDRYLEVDDSGDAVYRLDSAAGAPASLDNAIVRNLTPNAYAVDVIAENDLGDEKFHHEDIDTTDTDATYQGRMYRGDYVVVMEGSVEKTYRYVGEEGLEFYFNNTADSEEPSQVNADFTDTGSWQLYQEYTLGKQVYHADRFGPGTNSLNGNVAITKNDYASDGRQWYRYIGADATLSGAPDFESTDWQAIDTSSLGEIKIAVGLTPPDLLGYLKATFFKNDLVLGSNNTWYRYIGPENQDWYFEKPSNDILISDDQMADLTDDEVWQTVSVYTGAQVDRHLVKDTVDYRGFGAWNLQRATDNVSTTGIDESQYFTTATREDGVSVTANQASILESRNHATVSGAESYGVSIALNTLGYPEQDLLTLSFEALIGQSFLEDLGYTDGMRWGDATAKITDSVIDAGGGDVEVLADNSVAADATITNATNGVTSGVAGQATQGATGMLISNLARGEAIALIEDNYAGSGAVDITAADVAVTAKQNALLHAETILVNQSVTTSDGGAGMLDEFIGRATYADYLSTTSNVSLKNGDRVRVLDQGDENYGNVMVFIAASDDIPTYTTGNTAPTSGPVDLTKVDYSDLDFWSVSPETQIVPLGMNIDDADSVSVGALVVRNDMTGDATAAIRQTNIDASGSVSVNSDQSSDMYALMDANVVSSGGSALGDGTSLGVNASIATNWLQGDSHAYIAKSKVDAVADLSVIARNSAVLDAEAIQQTESGDKAIGIQMAFNAVGWLPQNLLFTAIDTFIGSEEIASAFDANQRASAFAHIDGSDIDVGGDLTVKTDNVARINALTSNDAIGTAIGIKDTGSTTVGVIIANNRVSGEGRAYISDRAFSDYANYDYDEIASTTLTTNVAYADMDVTGDAVVASSNASDLFSDLHMLSQSTAVNDGGATVILGGLETVVNAYRYSSKAGEQNLIPGEVVYVASDYSIANPLAAGDARGYLYRWVGAVDSTGDGVVDQQTLDLSTTDYTDTTQWLKVVSIIDLLQNVADYVNIGILSSESAAGGVLVSFNSVQGGSDAQIIGMDTATVGDDLTVQATDTSTLDAVLDIVVYSSGGGATAEGSSTAVGIVISTNQVDTTTLARILDSNLTVGNSNTASADDQGVSVLANSKMALHSVVDSEVRSNDTSIGVVLSFNSAGFGGSNILFSAIDTLVPEDPTGNGGFGSDDNHASLSATRSGKTARGINTQAIIESSSVTANNQGDIQVKATSENWVDADVTNAVMAFDFTLGSDSTNNLVVAPVMSLNRLKYNVEAYLQDNTSLIADDDLMVHARDVSRIDAQVFAPAVTGGLATSGSTRTISIGVGLARSAITGDVRAFVDNDLTSQTTAITADNVSVLAERSVKLKTNAAAAAVSISASGSGDGLAVGGGGAIALNELNGNAIAFIDQAAIDDGSNGNISGDVAVKALDVSQIDARIIAAAVSAGVSASSSATAVAIGFSLAYNVIGWGMNPGNPGSPDQLTAYIGDVDILAAGDISIQAMTGEAGQFRKIEAFVLAVAVGVGASGSGNAGAGSVGASIGLNRIAGNVRAYLGGASATNNTVVSGGTNGVSVYARDESAIKSHTIAASLAAGLSGGGTATSVAIAISYAENLIQNSVTAEIRNATLTATGNVTVDADQVNSTRAFGLAASVSAAIGGGGNAIAIAGGGILVRNVTTGDTYAQIINSSISGATDVRVTADNDSTIIATILAVSGSLAFSGSNTGAAVAIGAGAALNYIGVDQLGRGMADVHARVLNSDISATGDFSMTADSSMKIESVVIAGSLAVAASASNSIGGAGAGAGSGNTIAVSTLAFAQTTDQADGLQAGTITIQATNNSDIDAVTGGVSLGASIGGSASVAISIAVAAAVNTAHLRTAAYVSGYGNDNNGSAVGLRAATGDILVSAASNASIYADTVAASMAIAIGAGKVGFSLAGAGAGAHNEILGYTKAYIHDTDVRASNGDVTVTSTQGNVINALVLGVAASVGVGAKVGVGIALGAAAASNQIRGDGGHGPSDTATSITYDAQTYSGNQTEILARGDLVKLTGGRLYEYVGPGGAINMAALNTADLSTDSNWERQVNRYDVNFTHKAQMLRGDLFRAADGQWYEYVGSDQTGSAVTYFTDNDASDDDEDIEDQSTPLTDLTERTLWRPYNSDVQNAVFTGDFDVRSSITEGDIVAHNLRVNASTVNSIFTNTAAGAAAIAGGGKVGVGVAGSFAFTLNTVQVATRAFVDGDADSSADSAFTIAANDIDVTASDLSVLSTTTASASVAASFAGLAAVSVSFGGAVSRNVIHNTVEAYIADMASVTVASGGQLDVTATQTAVAITEAWAASAALAVAGKFSLALAGAGSEANNIVDNVVQAYVDNATVTTSGATGDVNVQARNDLTVRAKSGAIASAVNGALAGGSGAIGASIARNYVGRGFNIDLITEAERDRVDGDASRGGDSSGGVDNQDEMDHLLEVAEALVHQNTAQAFISDSTLTVGGDLNVKGELTQTATTESYAGSLAVGISIGGAVAAAGAESTTKFSSKSEALVLNSTLDVAGDINVLSTSDSLVDSADAIGASLGGGLVGISIGVAYIVVDIANDVDAGIRNDTGTNRVDVDGDLTVKADVTRAEVRDLEAVMASVAVGGVAAAGGGLGFGLTVDNDVDAEIAGSNLTVAAVGDVNVLAEEDADLRADAYAGTFAIGLGGAFGVSGVVNTIKSNVNARIHDTTVTGYNVTVKAYADSRIHETTSVAFSGGLDVAVQLNTAFANINTTVTAETSGAAAITATDTLTVYADQFSYLRAHGAGGAFSNVAIGGLLVQGAVGKGLVEFDQDEVQVTDTDAEKSAAYTYTTDDTADVVASIAGNVTAGSVVLRADYADDLFADATAAGGGAISLSGALTVLENVVLTDARVADSAVINAGTFDLISSQDQTNDLNADSYSIALASGAGAMAFMNNTSKAKASVGSATINARRITLDLDNALDKNRFQEEGYTLRTGSAAIGNVGILVNRADILNATQVDIANGAALTATGDYASPGRIDINATTDLSVFNKTLSESVSGFGVNVAVTETTVATHNDINIGSATLNAGVGNVQIFTDHEALVVSDTNLMMVSAISGFATAISNARYAGINSVDLTGSELQGRNVEIYAGQASDATNNDLLANGVSNIFAASMYPNISVPVALGSVVENNQINVNAGSRLTAIQDVSLQAFEGLAADNRVRLSGSVLSLSAIPYGVDAVKDSSESSLNSVVIADSARVTAGAQSDLSYLIFATDGVGFNPAGNVGLPSGVDLSSGPVAIDATTHASYLSDLASAGHDLSGGDYQFVELNLTDVALDAVQGVTVIQLVNNDGGTTDASTRGEVDEYYLFRDLTGATESINPNEINFGTSSAWQKLTGDAKTAVVNNTNSDVVVYQSNVVNQLVNDLDGAFYAITPQGIEAPKLRYTNVANNLLEQRNTLLGYMASHSNEPKSIARYQAQIDEIDRALDSYGLVTYEDVDGDGDLTDLSTGGAIKVIKRDLDVLVLDLPDLYAGIGSVVIRADGDTTAASTYQTQWATQLTANSSADVDIQSVVPLTVEVGDAMVLGNNRTMTVGDQFYSLAAGGVYFNGQTLESAVVGSSTIDIDLNYDSSKDWSTHLDVSGAGAVTSLNIVGNVYNQSGSVTAANADGGISVSGNVRAASVNIDSSAGLSINSDDIYHTNRDPRQYMDYSFLAGQAKARDTGNANAYSLAEDLAETSLASSIAQDTAKIQALGDITINARVVNVNGLIESGIKDYGLLINEYFAPTLRAAQEGGFNVQLVEDIVGVSFTNDGNGGQAFDAIYDASRNAIVVRNLVPQAGKVYITGTVISTGNGEIKVASGYASLDVDIDLGGGADLDVVFEGVDLTVNRAGLIQITDVNRLLVDTDDSANSSVGYGADVRTTYSLNGANVQKVTEGGRVLLENGRYTLDYQAAVTDNTLVGATTAWNPISGSRYVWVEGQATAEQTRYEYEQRSFTWSTIDAWNDGVVGDVEARSITTTTLDQTPLLESESVVVSADGSEQYNSAWTGTKIHVGYEEKADFAVDVSAGDVVFVEALTSDTVNTVRQYKGVTPSLAAAANTGSYYSYTGVDTRIELFSTDFAADTANWTLTNQADYDNNVNSAKHTTNDLRYDYTMEQYTTGGGYMRHKTAHTIITETLGKKDYFTYSLDADEAIAITFDQATTQSIDINTDGSVLLTDNLQLAAATATVAINAGAGIRGEGAAGILGASRLDLDAAGAIDLTLEGGASVSADIRTTTGNIDLDIVSETAGEADLAVDTIRTDAGDVTLTVGNDLTSASGTSLIQGNHVRLTSQAGSIGTSSQALRIDSSVTSSAPGGLAALASGDIYIQETAGDLTLIDPIGVATTASVTSTGGDVTLSTVAGNILDGWSEQIATLTDAEAEAKARELGIDASTATQDLINGQLDSEEQTKTSAYHTYWKDYRGAAQSGNSGLLTISGTDLSVTLSSISNSDLVGADYAAVNLTESDDAKSVALTAGQLVRDSQGNYYTVDNAGTYVLAGADLSSNTTDFTAATTTHNASADIRLSVTAGQIIQVADTELQANDVVVTTGNEILRYTGAAGWVYLPFASADLSEFETDTADHTAAGGVAMTASLNTHDLVYNSYSQQYFVYQGAATSSWKVPTGETSDWRAARQASVVPAETSRYAVVSNQTNLDLSQIVNFAASSFFENESLDADLINPVFPNVATNDLVLASSGTLWKYTGAGLTNPDLSRVNFADSVWTEQNLTDLYAVKTQSIGADEYVVDTDGSVYQYDGTTTTSIDLLAEDFSTGWTSVTIDHDLSSTVGTDTVEAYEIVELVAADGSVSYIQKDNSQSTTENLLTLSVSSSG